MSNEHYTARRNFQRNADIRALKASGVSAVEISKRYDLSITQVYRITNKKLLENK